MHEIDKYLNLWIKIRDLFPLRISPIVDNSSKQRKIIAPPLP